LPYLKRKITIRLVFNEIATILCGKSLKYAENGGHNIDPVITLTPVFQIYLTSRRVKVAGDVNACHTSATKCEEAFRKLTEQKSAQDLYLDKLSQDIEDLEQKCLDYDAQVTMGSNFIEHGTLLLRGGGKLFTSSPPP
jgi:hypothetical protein